METWDPLDYDQQSSSDQTFQYIRSGVVFTAFRGHVVREVAPCFVQLATSPNVVDHVVEKHRHPRNLAKDCVH